MGSEKLKAYYQLTKPGVLYGNVMTAVSGFLLAAIHFKHFNWILFFATNIGTTLVIAAACVLNNVLDQDIDKLMERTKRRAVASGEIASLPATVFAAVLGILGVLILIIWVNWLVVGIGLLGFVVYVWLYGALSKRRSIHGTLVGSISGAMPILAGYCAVAGHIDAAAVLVFLMLFFWQFPEFYSIAIYRRQEYAAAGIPVMSVVKGVTSTKVQIFVYTVAFVVSTLLLTFFGYTGILYALVMGIFGLRWIWMAADGLQTKESEAWARKMFHFSLIMLLLLSAILPLGALLP